MKVTFLGFGSHAGNLVDICNLKGYEIAGYIDAETKDIQYAKLENVEGSAILGFGGLSPDRLEQRYKLLADHEAHFLALHHPQAIISPSALFGDGVQIMAGAIVQHYAQVDSACIINTGAIIEHDCIIHRGCHIAPNATVLGDCEIGEFSFIGAGAIIVQGSKVPPRSFIKAGSVWHVK